MRSKKAFYNTLADMLLEAVSVVCGFIVPRLLLTYFGSALHGAVSSISQFIGYASLLAAGAGGVTKAALYRPVAEQNIPKISAIVRATELFMRKVALLFLAGLTVFAAVYPLATQNEFSFLFSASLVMILGAGTFAQYFFGNAYKMLLQADQKTYVTSIIQMMTLLLYTLLSVVLIRGGYPIHAVRLASAAVLVLNPLLIHFYTRKKYNIIQHIQPDHLAIKQRWDAFAHQIAEFVYSNSGLVIIAFLAGSRLASVYAVHAMVVSGMQRVVPLFLGGAESAFGNMIANNETKTLRKNLGLFELINYSTTNICLSCTIALLVPFVSLYTKGVTDADYHQPVFAFVFCLASYFFLLRKPYQAVVFAAGHFRQTRNGAIVECALSVILSIVLFTLMGLPGIAAGSLCVMPFRTIQYALYASKHIIFRSSAVFVKRFLISMLNLSLIFFAFYFIPSGEGANLVSFIVNAAAHFCVATAVTAGIAILFYRPEIRDMARKIRNVLTTSA